MNSDNNPQPATTLPIEARLPINRCNLPPQILGSLTFQQHPTALHIDGVFELHKHLFSLLDTLDEADQRAQRFMDYMVVQFRLHQLEDAGLMNDEGRGRANYLRLLRGWMFNPDGREAAVIKSWGESRFGLLPRFHNGRLDDPSSETYQQYLAARTEGLYGTNALEAQLDLLYSYCQYELARQYQEQQHITLYRGVNRLGEYDILQQHSRTKAIVLLNNINACSHSRERAGEFGDMLMTIAVPWQKVLFYSSLLPHFTGEEEYLIIGGVYEVTLQYW